MLKRLLPILILLAYIAILIKVMVFKDIPMIRVGQLMLNFGGTDAGHAPNFVPFKTIIPYLFGFKGLMIAGINIVGNIILLIPIGFLSPFVVRRMRWQKALLIGVLSGLLIETMQVVLKVGIFDIDDVILNAVGVMIGYWAIWITWKWLRERKYMHILILATMTLILAGGAFYFVYPWGQSVRPDVLVENSATENMASSGDLCGGTGGTGEIVRVENESFIIRPRSGATKSVTLASGAVIKDSFGPISISELKIGDHVTLVGDAYADDTFIADAVLVCSI